MAGGKKVYTPAENVCPTSKLTVIQWVKAAWNDENEEVIRKSFHILTDLKTSRFAASKKELWRLQQRTILLEKRQDTQGLKKTRATSFRY